MTPEDHKAEIVRALNRCRQAAWLDEGLNKQLESALDALVNDYQACLLHNDLLAARLRLGDFHYRQPDLRSPEVQALRKDTERLDFMISEECQIQSLSTPNEVRHRLGWPDYGETQSEWSVNPRAAIDAAMEKQK